MKRTTPGDVGIGVPALALLLVLANSSNFSQALAEPRDFDPRIQDTLFHSFIDFDIPASSIEAALIRFGEQSGISVVIHNQAIGLGSSSIHGVLKPYDALETLLGDTGLDFRLSAGGIIVFQPIALLGNEGEPEESDNASSRLREPDALTAAADLMQGASQAIEEIVVTAQKREQSAQEMGIAVTSFSKRDMRELGMLRPDDLSAQTPGLDIKNALGALNPIFTMRGVGLNDYNVNNNPSVGVYVDEVYMASSAYLSFQVFDLERIEILKGPQGTLYGRNTTGGAVNFVTARPGTNFEAYLDIDYGRWNTLKIEGAMSGAISEKISGRIAVQANKSDGYYTNNGTTVTSGLLGPKAVTLDERGFGVGQPSAAAVLPGNSFVDRDDDFFRQDTRSIRATLDWDISAVADITMSLHQVNDTSDMLARSMGFISIDANGFSPVDDDPYTVDANFGAGGRAIDVTGYGGYLKFNIDLGATTLTAVSGYESIDRMLPFEDSSPWRIIDQQFDEDMYMFSQEVRLASVSDESFFWMLGLYYSEEQLEFSKGINGLDGLLRTSITTEFEQLSKSTAIFGQVEWPLHDRLKVTAGLRYTDDDKSYSGGSFIPIEPYGPYGVDLAPTFWDLPLEGSEKLREDNVSGKVNLDWLYRPGLLFYLSWNKGYKSGGFDGSTITDASAFTPFFSETLYAWETGIKSRWFEERFQWNLSVFLYDYDDVQAEAQRKVQVGENTFESIRSNAGNADIWGFETEFWYKPRTNVDIKIGVAHLDSEITDWFVDGLDSDDPAVVMAAQAAILAHVGNDLPDSPDLTVSGLVRYQHALTDSLRLVTSLDFNYVDELYKNIDNDEHLKAASYWLLNARMTLASENERWQVSLWGKNLADEIYFRERFENFGSQWIYETPGVPKSYGLSLKYRWD
ncbi:MAG: TonB-dependent receptor [Pseudomonadales bacterium]|nr:TonB-dependent receptor [Pseudomonadales bacterium]